MLGHSSTVVNTHTHTLHVSQTGAVAVSWMPGQFGIHLNEGLRGDGPVCVALCVCVCVWVSGALCVELCV